MKRVKSAAMVLLVAMFFNVFPVQALAVAAQNENSYEESLREELRTSVDEAQYPNGMFEFITTRMNTSENLDSSNLLS